MIPLCFRPSQTLVLSFLGLIVIGTALLCLPFATVDGQGAPFLDALFTTTSAVCVTGLTVNHIGSYYSIFGQVVILFGMQIGGLGIAVLSAIFAVLLGGRIPSRLQMGLEETLDLSTARGLKKLVLAIATITFVTELIGVIALVVAWREDFLSGAELLWNAVFHVVSAFNNAGLGLFPDSLAHWVGNGWVNGIFIILITLGGAGFFVIADLCSPEAWVVKRPGAVWSRLEIQTRVVIVVSLLLNCAGAVFFLFFEFDGALQGLSIGDKVGASLFQAVALRTAGFSTVSLAHIAAPTIILSLLWMFIGASPGSTGGGIKTTTAAVAVVTIRAMLRGRQDVELCGRRLPASIISRSLSIMLIAGMTVLLFFACIAATQELPFSALLYEVVSAFGTVGLTLGITPSLNETSRVLIIVLMFVGRVGPLTLALAVGERKTSGYHLPEGRLAVG